MDFCSPFDQQLAQAGPPAVFIRDQEGSLRFEASWTRDAYGRAPGPHEHGWSWTLMRDRGNGFVLLALVTSPTLITAHPRLDLQAFSSLEAAERGLAAFGDPPVCTEAW